MKKIVKTTKKPKKQEHSKVSFYGKEPEKVIFAIMQVKIDKKKEK